MSKPQHPSLQDMRQTRQRLLYSADARKSDLKLAMGRAERLEANRNWLAGRTSKRAVSRKNQSGRLTEQAEAINMAAAIAVVTL